MGGNINQTLGFLQWSFKQINSVCALHCAMEVEDIGGTCCSGGIRMTVLMPPWLPEKSHTSCTCKQFYWSSMQHHQFHHNHLHHRPHHNHHHQNRPQDGTHKAVAIIARMCCRRQRSSFYRQRGRLGSLNYLQTKLSSIIQKLQSVTSSSSNIQNISNVKKKGADLGAWSLVVVISHQTLLYVGWPNDGCKWW